MVYCIGFCCICILQYIILLACYILYICFGLHNVADMLFIYVYCDILRCLRECFYMCFWFYALLWLFSFVYYSVICDMYCVGGTLFFVYRFFVYCVARVLSFLNVVWAILWCVVTVIFICGFGYVVLVK